MENYKIEYKLQYHKVQQQGITTQITAPKRDQRESQIGSEEITIKGRLERWPKEKTRQSHMPDKAGVAGCCLVIRSQRHGFQVSL